MCKIRWSPKVTTTSITNRLEPNIRWVARTLGIPHADAAKVGPWWNRLPEPAPSNGCVSVCSVVQHTAGDPFPSSGAKWGACISIGDAIASAKSAGPSRHASPFPPPRLPPLHAFPPLLLVSGLAW